MTEEILRLLAVFPCLVQLQCDPERIGIAGRVEEKDSTTVVTDDEKAVHNAEVRVGTVKKSIAAIASRWFRKKVSHRFAGSGGLGAR